MNRLILLLCLLTSVHAFSQTVDTDQKNYPTSPSIDLTPGELCTKPDMLRYPEQISYCHRDVDSSMKSKVIQEYMQKISGFNITFANRNEYKIDHYIPLCMGGANTITNLWPQHMSVYKYTDSLELNICKELELGKITQAVAVLKIKFAKNYLQQVIESPDAMAYVRDNYDK